jgi:hypothetical protein
MIEKIIFYAIGIVLLYIFYRIVKSQLSGKAKCHDCVGKCLTIKKKK